MEPTKQITDATTGYLVNEDGTGIQSKHKSGFLKAFRKTGDKTRAADAQGFRYVEFEWHLNNDPKFQSDYKDTMLAMKHEIEGPMFEKALTANGQKEREKWLAVNYPGEYGVKTAGKGERSKSRVENLLEQLK